MPIMIKFDKVFTTALVLGSLKLIATMSYGVSNKFEVNAADNCDATSTCQNTDLVLLIKTTIALIVLVASNEG